MAVPVVHAELTMFPDGFPLSLAKPAQNQAALDASIGDPTRNFTEGAADSGAAHPSSCHLFRPKGCVSQDPCAVFGNPNAQSRAHVSCFAHPHSVSADTNGKSQADCAGLPCPVALSDGAQVHSTPGNEGRMYLQQFSVEYSTMACTASHEEGVHFLHRGQGDPTERHGHKEDRTTTNIKVNDLHAPSRVVCTGSAHETTKFHDPSVLLSMASVNSCEESTSLHEEGGDTTGPQGSHEGLTPLHAQSDESCDHTEDFAYTRRIGVASADGYEGIRDPIEEVLDPYLQQADADATSSLQPCSSECSSAISMVSNATSEITSRLDSNCNVDAIESYWTDAKHGSYLDYMETSFVKNLYGREYCAMDVCGQQSFHQASQNSSPWPSTLFEFKSWQSGDWHRRSMLKPPLLTCIPLALRPSPWVNHFRPRKVSQARQQIKIEDVSTFCGVDGEEEVDSPSIDEFRGALGHDHASGSNFGLEERLLCKIDNIGSEAVGVVSKHDGLQEFAYELDMLSSRNTKKRRLENQNIEQEQARQILEKYTCR